MVEPDATRPPSSPGGDSEAHLLVAADGAGDVAAYCADHLGAAHEGPGASLAVLTGRPTGGAVGQEVAAVVLVVDGPDERADGGQAVADRSPVAAGSAVSAPDLASAGPTVDGYLVDWAAAGHRPVVCVDSLDGLVEVSSVQGAYRFLYVLLRRVATIGAAAHVHADPRHHQGEILRTFHALFDRVVTFRDAAR